MRSFAALSLLGLAGLSTAQDQYTIDPDTVTQSTREYWCKQQKSQCPLICLQQPGVETQNTVSNDCDPDTLNYSCVCDDGSSPNITKYTQTMPYFVCTEWGTQCVKACGTSDPSCADSCRADHPCGAQDPVKPNATASASSSTSSSTASQTSTEAAATNTGLLGESSGSNSNGTGGAMAIGASFGTLALSFAGVVAFAFL
ncbi:hypothetical protein K458DRAFT_405499 [Lentithecium fluviatile CBS 122367]|uniref:DUF7707 domain-containing protein n=1 Tax=Lentithecium fluviatile CBS 122367 TaxID=1168545 RepID=A0A6G1IWX6_9PLEO|nr:hypothetical protein K458DRAFT_405499 [Lentithecium fluviatile CBS 122367]